LTICIFCSKEISPKEYPIPVAQIHFQPVLVAGRGSGDDILQGKYSCQACHGKILQNAAKAAADDGKKLVEAGNAH